MSLPSFWKQSFPSALRSKYRVDLPQGLQKTESCMGTLPCLQVKRRHSHALRESVRGPQFCPLNLRGSISAPPFHPPPHHSEQISRRQSQVDRLYVALKELGEERRVSLEQQYWLYQLSRQVDELEHWIAEKELVAGSPELGQDFEHVTVSNNSHASGHYAYY